MKEDFNKFIDIYEKNKNLVKDNSFKTIEKFMLLFKNPNFEKLDNDNELDFLVDDKILFKFKEEDYYLENIEKEYLILIYISQKENIPENFFEKIFKALIDIFDPIKILYNIKFFKKCFKFYLKHIKNRNIFELINNDTNINESKQKIITFLYYYNYFCDIKSNQNNINNNINFDYIKFIFELKNTLNLYITKETESISCQNYFNYLFNKHF